jgi:UDP-perosamine 4-acetyltransferase
MSDRAAYIIGSGGHAHVIRSFLPNRRICFLVDRDPGPEDMLQEEFFAAPPAPDSEHYIGIGDNDVRRAYFDRLSMAGLRISNCIAPTAWVASDSILGEGIFVGAGAVIGSRARLGDNVIVNTLASVDHDCSIGSDAQLGPGVILAGGVVVGRNAFLGLRSAVLPGVAIGDGAVVMAGALVTRNVAAGTRVGGLPARIMNEDEPGLDPA